MWKARRLAWFEAQPALDPARLVFIDETGASTKMARLRGRAPRGARCRGRRSRTATGRPYSPDFNPIEQAFAKLKALLRKAAARTLDALQTAIAAALDAFATNECANYFTASGSNRNDRNSALTSVRHQRPWTV